MNEIIKSLHDRRSVRVFTDEAVSVEEKRMILEAAVQAPTAGNQQLYTILDITDRGLKEELAVLCDNQAFIAKAPVVLVFLADCQKWYDAFADAGCEPRLPGCGDLMLAVDDTLIAAQNAAVAAESLGLGSCYVGDVMERCEKARELLGLTDYVFPAAMLVIGHPTEQQKLRPKPGRCAMEHIVHENTYRHMEGAELRDMLGYKAGGLEYEDWIAAFCKRKYNSDFSREMSRSVLEYIKKFM